MSAASSAWLPPTSAPALTLGPVLWRFVQLRSCLQRKSNPLSPPDLLVVPKGVCLYLSLTRLLRSASTVEVLVDVASFWFCPAYVVVCKVLAAQEVLVDAVRVIDPRLLSRDSCRGIIHLRAQHGITLLTCSGTASTDEAIPKGMLTCLLSRAIMAWALFVAA